MLQSLLILTLAAHHVRSFKPPKSAAFNVTKMFKETEEEQGDSGTSARK